MTESEKLNQELIEDIAEMELAKLNPSFGGQPLSEKHKRYFISEIRNRRWELKGRQVTPLTDTGAPVSDEHGWPVPFADVIREIAGELFDVPEKKSTPGVMTSDEFISAMKAAATPQEQIEVMNAWTEQQRRK